MCARRHTEPVQASHPTQRLASGPHAISDAIAFLLVLVATAAILALAGIGLVGLLNTIAWLVAMSRGQIISGLIAAAGIALLLLTLVREAPSRLARVKARVRSALVRVRSVLVGVLMMAAGLALLLVQRLDREALPRVLANVKAAMWSAIVAERSRR